MEPWGVIQRLIRSPVRSLVSALIVLQLACLLMFSANYSWRHTAEYPRTLVVVDGGVTSPSPRQLPYTDNSHEDMSQTSRESQHNTTTVQPSIAAPAQNKTPDQLYEEHVFAWCKDEKIVSGTQKSDQPCPCMPDGLHGREKPDLSALTSLTWRSALALVNNTGPGGHWRPSSCTPRRRVAVIIPCRDREVHLRAFLAHTHPILQRQLLEYRVFVVEQDMPYTFNKASMMNIGFLEAQKSFNPDCVLFHDVDMLMENDRHIVVCGNTIQHMGAYINKLKYKVRYETLLGGAMLARTSDFVKLNGFSNLFFGWGGEDDDFSNRVRWRKLGIYRAPLEIASYTMIKHRHDSANPQARDGYERYIAAIPQIRRV